ncbi:glycosyltransferase family 4 protein [Vibrio lentus]
MKIIITTKCLERGGSEVLLSQVIPNLISYGYQVEVVYFKLGLNDLAGEIASYGAKVKYIGPLSFFSFFGTVFRYFSYVIKSNPRVIFEHSPIVSVLTRLLFFKKKIVYLEHSVLDNYNIFTRNLNKITYPLISHLICCSEQVHNSNGRKGIVLSNAVKLAEDNIVPELSYPGYKVIIAVANLSVVKNHQMLIDAFGLMKYKDVKLVIVGQARDNYDNVIQAINNSPKKEDIILYGESHDVYPLLASSDIFCLTSRHEGLPISLLEAMSMGVVPVCTSVGGITSVVGCDEGFLVDDFDTSVFSNYLDMLCNDDVMRENMSHKAKKKVIREFNLNNYCESLHNIFKRC